MPKKKKLDSASKSARYRRFITERDKALEVLLQKSTAEMHDILRGTFEQVKEKVALAFSNTRPLLSSSVDGSFFIDSIDKQITHEFEKAANLIGGLFLRLRINTYTLALAGEVEAIGQALDRKVSIQLSRDEAMEAGVAGFDDVAKRIRFAFDKLRRKIINAVQLSRIEGANVADTLSRVDRALPYGDWVMRPQKVLKRIKEAAKSSLPKEDMAIGFYDEPTWNSMVQEYLKEYVPTYQFRSPKVGADYQYKGFEIERDMTHDFVATVRQASKDGAYVNGITDFEWIAILDDHTCDECCGDYGCADFDGKSTREIEKMTKGEYSVPPAHYNCRCTIAPLLEGMPELPESNAKEFEEWLNS